MGQIATMTLDEARIRLRDVGLGMDKTTLADGIEQGAFPFGVCITTKHDGRVFKIFARLLEDWISERSVEDSFSKDSRIGFTRQNL